VAAGSCPPRNKNRAIIFSYIKYIDCDRKGQEEE
jgi:hypothetical protein